MTLLDVGDLVIRYDTQDEQVHSVNGVSFTIEDGINYALSGTAGAIGHGASVVALGVGAHGYRPVRGAYLMAVLPENVAKGSLGVVRTLLVTAGAVAPAAVGYLSEVSGFRVAFGLLAAVLGAATALTMVLWVVDR